MNPIIEPLKRLYDSNQVTETKIMELYRKGTLTEKDKNYILGKEE